MIDGVTEISIHPDQRCSFIERTKISILLGKPNRSIVDRPEYKTALPMIQDTFGKAWAWHGTGRYQYDPKDRSQVRDVLQTIISENGLIPHTDILDFTKGEMQSISTSPVRLYSLMYAQCHFEKGKSFFSHTQNGLIWAHYLAPMAYRGVIEALVNNNPDYLKMLDRDTRDAFGKAANKFHGKYTRTGANKYDMPKGGISDIEGNYPMIIGIRQGSFQPTEIARLIDKHEMRSRTPIFMENLTHIEVPEEKVNEVIGVLQTHGINIPIYPIEWGIEYTKTLPLKTILDGKK
jgi:hypothetical protein